MCFRRLRGKSVRILDFYNFFIDFDWSFRRNDCCFEKETVKSEAFRRGKEEGDLMMFEERRRSLTEKERK